MKGRERKSFECTKGERLLLNRLKMSFVVI